MTGSTNDTDAHPRLAIIRPSRPKGRAPGYSLHLRAVMVTLSLVAGAAGLCALLLAQMTQREIAGEMQNAARTAGASLSGALRQPASQGDRATLAAEILTAMADPRLAFVTLIDARNGWTIERVREQAMWSAYQAHLSSRSDPLDDPIGTPQRLRSEGLVVGYFYRTVVRETDDGPALSYLTLGVSDPTYRIVRAGMTRTAIVSTSVAALVAIPLVVIGVSRLTAPIHAVALAARELSRGRRPAALPESGPSEIATLGRSFNTMAAKLSSAHDALRAVNSDLEQTVALRTQELRRVNDLLRLEISEKNEFIRTVSHDLGAPLRNIAGMAELILSQHTKELPDDAVHRLERITANVQTETQMLDDLLELSQIGLRAERPARVDIGELLDEMAGAFEHDLRLNDVSLVIERPMPIVHVEPGRLRMAFQNLIDNAIKYMGDSKERRIRIWSERLDDDGVAISIADTGPGVPEKDRERIFQLFRRGTGVSRQVTGKGVGLAAVRATVERWSGKLTLTSEPGEGAVFTCTIPSDRVESSPSGSQSPSTLAAT